MAVERRFGARALTGSRITVATGSVVPHAVVVLHGLVYVRSHVALSPGENVFVILVIPISPIVALALLRGQRAAAGAVLFFAAMLGAFSFGVYHPIPMSGPNQLSRIPTGPWQAPFPLDGDPACRDGRNGRAARYRHAGHDAGTRGGIGT